MCAFDHVKEMRIFQTIGQYFENMGLIKGVKARERMRTFGEGVISIMIIKWQTNKYQLSD